jgi:hypothetical protein
MSVNPKLLATRRMVGRARVGRVFMKSAPFSSKTRVLMVWSPDFVTALLFWHEEAHHLTQRPR